MGRCDRCGVEGYGSGVCSSCASHISWMNNMMEMTRQAQQTSYNIHMGIYHDNGCCGCNVHRRRLLFLVLTVGFFIGAAVTAILREKSEVSIGLAGAGALWMVCGLCCPNGCCGMYANNREWGVLTPAVISGYCRKCGSRSSRYQDTESASLMEAANNGVPLTPAQQSNINSVQSFFDVYNAPNEQVMQVFVQTCYEPTYVSQLPGGKTNTYEKLPFTFRDAWSKGRKCSNVVFHEVGEHFAAYSYSLRWETGAMFHFNVIASFHTPGKFSGAVYTMRK